MDKSNLAILMATYNGERYISAQIKSVLNQSCPHWRLYIRDDASQDETPSVISEFSQKLPEQILVVPSDGNRLGVDGNFSYLMEHVDSDYFMFCDQDDVWLPDKIEKSLRLMRTLEEENESGTPVLVHTDLRVVDDHLRELDSSAWHYGNHNPEFSQQLNRLLVQNMVFGCSILINRNLKELAAPIPAGVVQFDWWLALVALCFGVVGFISEPTLLYRQHGGNTVGTKKWGLKYILNKCVKFWDREGLIKSLTLSRAQARVLLNRYESSLRSQYVEMLSTYAALGELNFLEKRKTLLRYRFLKTGLIRNIGLFSRV